MAVMPKLLTYAGETGPRAGLLVEESVLDLQAGLDAYCRKHDVNIGFSGLSVLSVLEAWDAALPMLYRVASGFADGELSKEEVRAQSLSQIKLHAPILYPGAIFGATANYVDHIKEMNVLNKRAEVDPPDKSVTRPCFFFKSVVHSVIGPGDPIQIPANFERIDWEAEIGVVIGRAARNVSREEAMKYVAGFTIVNDLSDKSERRSDNYAKWFGLDWFRIKCFDGSAPMGPWIALADEVTDPHNLSIQLWVNEKLMQNGSSRLMYFTIPEQIQYLSEKLTLRPGDVISTGTCSGVGGPRGLFLKPGDEVKITISGLGTLCNPVTAGPSSR